ncbi:MAG TPA: S24 family peptidase [Bacteroidia bacterium]|nr:S24 family peptidase [Bacteroidia bacterium]
MKTNQYYMNEEPDDQMLLTRLPFLLTGKHKAFSIKDDSMPPLCKGNIIICKHVETTNEIKDGNTYIINTESNDFVYKRVKKDRDKRGILTLVSDSRFYVPYDIRVSDILEAWEFVCSLNIGSYKPEEINITSVMKMLRELKVEIKPIG